MAGALGGSVASTQTLTFAVGNGSDGVLILDHALTQPFNALISGLGDNDNIDLKDLAFTSGHMTAATSYAVTPSPSRSPRSATCTAGHR